jgi:hypothetical protein
MAEWRDDKPANWGSPSKTIQEGRHIDIPKEVITKYRQTSSLLRTNHPSQDNQIKPKHKRSSSPIPMPLDLPEPLRIIRRPPIRSVRPAFRFRFRFRFQVRFPICVHELRVCSVVSGQGDWKKGEMVSSEMVDTSMCRAVPKDAA